MNTHQLKFSLWLAVMIGIATIGVVLFATQSTQAAPTVSTLNVNTTIDAIDDNAGNGICHTVANQCSLRAAIMEANKFTTPVTINIPSGVYILSIPPITPTDGITNGDLNLTPPPSGIPVISIIGAGMNSTIIDGHHTDRVFSVSAGRPVIINNLTIRNGSVGLYQDGGGLINEGGVILNAVRVFSNSAVGGLGGGGIYNNNRMTINNSLIDGNITPLNYGGGILNAYGGSLRINDSTLRNNRAPNGTGGGIYDASGQSLNVIISNSTIYSNSAGYGGGLARDWNVGGPLRVYNSAITSNTATYGNGGAIDVGYFNGGNLHVVNSTISGNTANHDGGGIAIEKANSQVYLYNTTIVYNSAGSGFSDDYAGKGGGIASLAGAVFTSQYSIIAWNTDWIPNALLRPDTNFVPEDNQCYGTIYMLVSSADNIMSDYNLLRCQIDGSGVTLIDPLIGPLRNNGGSTWTHALLPGSPAIDVGGFCSDDDGNTLTIDQRGFARFTDGFCDIGAYEYEDNWIYLPLVVKNH
jgi:CSLREA domain-containing protein